MASGIFALFDDIAMLTDDVALTAKVAAKKTVGLLGDDLAVNAEKATGFDQKRELKVIWEITKGSLVNKVIILPLAFLLNYFASWAIDVALICGSLYLLYEGTEKINEALFYHGENVPKEHKEKLQKTTIEDVVEVEKKKIKSAIVTDFILSIEIVIVTLSTVMESSLLIQIATTTIIAFLATVGVYGLVALIVRLDNVGLWLIEKKYETLGQALIDFMPKLIRTLTIIGTIAMLLVGGGILAHNVGFFHHYFIDIFPGFINELILGLVVGVLVFAVIYGGKKLIVK